MPYIKQENRSAMDEVVLTLSSNVLPRKELAYVLIHYCMEYIKPSYNNYKNYIGELSECEVEMCRRIYDCPIGQFYTKPQVTEKRKTELDVIVTYLGELDLKINGDLNYILFKYCRIQFNHYGEVIDELRRAIYAIRRDILAPYEDTKIIENGDV